MKKSFQCTILLPLVLCSVPSDLQAQYRAPGSYTDHYRSELARNRYNPPPVDPRNYTIQKYFYERPTVSPYLNLTRPGRGPAAQAKKYYLYAKPELERRRKAQQVAQRPTPARTRPSPPAKAGHYYNHWYGGRQAMGLK